MRTLEKLKNDVCAEIDRHGAELIAFGEDVWKHPETGFREWRTSRLAEKMLASWGFSVRSRLALTGFRADLETGKEGPVVAIPGEMDSLIIPSHPDALPENGAVHACGHNTHIVMMLAVALGLAGADAAGELSGKVAFIGTPAEEGNIEPEFRRELIAAGKIRFPRGKMELLAEGVFDDVDMAVFLHASGGYAAYDGNGCVQKKLIFHGRSAHAAEPWKGVNALNMAVIAMEILAENRHERNPDQRRRSGEYHSRPRRGGISIQGGLAGKAPAAFGNGGSCLPSYCGGVRRVL